MQDPSSQSTSARETREAEGRSATATATHGEMRRAGATAAPRQDDGAKEAMVAMPMAEKQQVVARSTVVRSLIFHADPAKKSAESAAMVKLKGEELARGRVEGVDGDGEDGR